MILAWLTFPLEVQFDAEKEPFSLVKELSKNLWQHLLAPHMSGLEPGWKDSGRSILTISKFLSSSKIYDFRELILEFLYLVVLHKSMSNRQLDQD